MPASRASVTGRSSQTTAVAWALLVVVVVVPYVHWLQELEAGTPINPYTAFPLLGVWAWSLMWTHYAHGTLTLVSGRFVRSELYGRVTGWLVLVLLIAHPGLLVGAQLVDTELDPVTGVRTYADGAGWAAVLGAVALLAFLAYEALTRFGLKARLGAAWRWVGLAQMAAMALVFAHGLVLGRHLEQATWFRHWWVLLGALLIPCFLVIGRADRRAARPGAQGTGPGARGQAGAAAASSS